jgi:hypothetical protein
MATTAATEIGIAEAGVTGTVMTGAGAIDVNLLSATE